MEFNGIRSIENNKKKLYLRKQPVMFHTEQNMFTYTVLWISSRQVAKCDPLRGWAIQHDLWSRPPGDPTLNKWEHDYIKLLKYSFF